MSNLKLLYSDVEVADRVMKITDRVANSYRDDTTIVAVCVLKGSVLFYADLVRGMEDKRVVFDFVTLSSYGDNQQSSGKVEMVYPPLEDVRGRHVLIVEDIIDSGRTIEFLRDYYADKNALSVKVVCLLDKPKARKVPAKADFAAITLNRDAFVVGCGLDHAQLSRNKSGIYEVVEP